MKYPGFLIRVNKICSLISGVIVLGASALAVMESILRKVFENPTTWSFNLTEGVFIWAAFLASPWAFQELGHVSVDMLRSVVDKHSKSEKRQPRRIMSILGYAASFAVICVILYGGLILCETAIRLDRVAPYNFHFPLIISYSAIVVGSVLMLATLIFIIIDLLSGGDKYM